MVFLRNEAKISAYLLRQLNQEDHFFTRIDAITGEEYYSIRDVKRLSLKLLESLSEELVKNPYPIAEAGDNAVFLLRGGGLVIFENISLKELHHLLWPEQVFNQEFSLSFKIAEYHSYMSLKELNSNKVLDFSIVPKIKGGYFGYAYLRNDTLYNNIYFKGHLEKELNTHTYLIDWASVELKFYISQLQAKNLIHNYLEPIRLNADADRVTYNILFNNCHTFVKQVFQWVFDENVTPAHYLQMDKADLNDKGQYYNFLQSSFYTTAFKNPTALLGVAINLIQNETWDQYLNKLQLWWYGFPESLISNALVCAKLSDKILDAYNKPASDVHHISKIGYQNTLLHFAAYKNCSTIFSLSPSVCVSSTEMLKMINAQNFLGDTPLHIAAQQGNVQLVSFLLKIGADSNILNKNGYSVIHMAISGYGNAQSKIDMMKILLNISPAAIHQKDFKGECVALFEAARMKNLEFLKFIAEQSDLYCTNREGFNVGHIASNERLSIIYNYLEENNQDILNIKSKYGYTANDVHEQHSSAQSVLQNQFNELNFCNLFDTC